MTEGSSSKMASVYVHLSGRDLDATIYGIEKQDETKKLIGIKICSICDERNAFDSRYCRNCGSSLTMDWKSFNTKLGKFLEIVADNPEIIEMIKAKSQ